MRWNFFSINRPINNYIDLVSSFGLARFYGDRLYITDTQKTIHKSDILKFSIHLFKKKVFITLNLTNKPIHFSYNNQLISWLDPLYFLKLFVVGLCFVVSLFLSLYYIGIHNIGVCIAYIVFNISTLFIYYKLINLPFTKSFLYSSIFFICYNFPLLLFIPFATTIWIFFSFLFISYALIRFFITSESFLLNKFFISLICILLNLSCFYWLIGYLKVRYHVSLMSQIQVTPEYHISSGKYDIDKLQWLAPYRWQIERYSKLESLLQARELIFQILPAVPFAIVHFPDEKYSGWVSAVNQMSPQVLQLVANYLNSQKKVIFSKLLYVGDVIRLNPDTSNKKNITMLGQQYLFFDFKTSKEVIINVITATSLNSDNHNPKSYLWLLKGEDVTSLEYLMTELSDGLSN